MSSRLWTKRNKNCRVPLAWRGRCCRTLAAQQTVRHDLLGVPQRESPRAKKTMDPTFNPYHRWLGISPADLPPNHYRLLGLDLFEDDPEAIRDAVEQRMGHVRRYQLGKHVAVSQRILNELALAKACLQNPEKKAAYDARLRAEIAKSRAATALPTALGDEAVDGLPTKPINKELGTADKFDPYHEWLGISPKDQPPHHYRLLGIDLFESSANVISNAADQRMAHLRSFQAGKHAVESQKILNEIAAARVCLLNPAKKAEYDELLQNTEGPVPDPDAAAQDAGAVDLETIGAASYIDSDVPVSHQKASRTSHRKGTPVILAAAIGIPVVLLLLFWIGLQGGSSKPVAASKEPSRRRPWRWNVNLRRPRFRLHANRSFQWRKQSRFPSPAAFSAPAEVPTAPASLIPTTSVPAPADKVGSESHGPQTETGPKPQPATVPQPPAKAEVIAEDRHYGWHA